MKPQFKKTKRKGDLQHPWEYQGWLINSGSRMMYNQSIWKAHKDGQPIIVSNSLNNLCIEIDRKEQSNVSG